MLVGTHAFVGGQRSLLRASWEPGGAESGVKWTGVVSGVVALDQVILGPCGVAGRGAVQDREVSDPTPAIGSG